MEEPVEYSHLKKKAGLSALARMLSIPIVKNHRSAEDAAAEFWERQAEV